MTPAARTLPGDDALPPSAQAIEAAKAIRLYTTWQGGPGPDGGTFLRSWDDVRADIALALDAFASSRAPAATEAVRWLVYDGDAPHPVLPTFARRADADWCVATLGSAARPLRVVPLYALPAPPAARPVCHKCGGTGQVDARNVNQGGPLSPCPDCAARPEAGCDEAARAEIERILSPEVREMAGRLNLPPLSKDLTEPYPNEEPPRAAGGSGALEDAAKVCEQDADLCDRAAEVDGDEARIMGVEPERPEHGEKAKACAFVLRAAAKRIHALAQPAGGEDEGGFTLRELQDRLPWTIHYHHDFRASPVAHKDFQHALIHVFKAAGKLAAMVNDAEHAGFDWAQDKSPDPYIADLVICALRMANTIPSRACDLGASVVTRIETKNGVKLPPRPAASHAGETTMGEGDRLALLTDAMGALYRASKNLRGAASFMEPDEAQVSRLRSDDARHVAEAIEAHLRSVTP